MRAYGALNRPAWRIHSPGVLDPVHVRNHFTRELGDLTLDCAGRRPARSATKIQKEYSVDART